MARTRWKRKHGGLTLRSGLEKKTAQYLDSKKVEYGYESEKLKYIVPAKQHSYTPDFILPNGVIVEVKGRFDAASRTKMIHVIEQNPDRDIRLLFSVDNKINKSSKTRYSDWCSRRNIVYCISADGVVPDDWLKGRKRRRKLDADET